LNRRRKVLLGIAGVLGAGGFAIREQVRCVFTSGWSGAALLSAFGQRLHAVTSITLHHTGGRQFTSVGAVDVELLESVHQNRGFCAVCGCRTYYNAYHFVVLADGSIETGRPEYCVGAHSGVKTINETSLGVALVGDFSVSGPDSTQPVNDLQLGAATALVADLLKTYELTLEQVKLHRDVRPGTECPGKEFPAALFRRIVAERLSAI
jgi:N-acetylmuramoyl-L-alanine amidase